MIWYSCSKCGRMFFSENECKRKSNHCLSIYPSDLNYDELYRIWKNYNNPIDYHAFEAMIYKANYEQLN